MNGNPEDYWPDGLPPRPTEHVLDNYPYHVWGWCVMKHLVRAEAEVERLQDILDHYATEDFLETMEGVYELWTAAEADRETLRADWEQALCDKASAELTADHYRAEVERLKWMLEMAANVIVKGTGRYRPEEAMTQSPSDHLAEERDKTIAALVARYKKEHDG